MTRYVDGDVLEYRLCHRERERVVLRSLGGRVRSRPVAGGEGAHAREQGRDGDLLVREPPAGKRIAPEHGAVETQVLAVVAIEVEVIAVLIANDGGVEDRPLAGEPYDLVARELAERAPHEHATATQLVVPLVVGEVVQSCSPGEVDS